MNPFAPSRITGAWVLKAFGIGFGIVVAANAALLYFAITSWRGLETENAYEKGLAHNTVLADGQAQAGLGWTVAVRFDRSPNLGDARQGQLIISVRDAAGESVGGLNGRALVRRPIGTGDDWLVELEPAERGVYRAHLSLPAAGQWDVRLELEGGPRPYRVRRRIVIE